VCLPCWQGWGHEDAGYEGAALQQPRRGEEMLLGSEEHPTDLEAYTTPNRGFNGAVMVQT